MKIKWIVTGLLALVVAIVVAGVAILSTMEFEELRGVIEAEAKEATGRELEIAGPIDVRISWNPAIAVQDVRFANAAWGSRATMISVRRFELEVALLPLLSGDIQIKRLVVVEPNILLETDSQGRGNWELAPPTTEKAEDKSESAAALPSFDNVLVRDAVLTYRDGRTGEELRLRLSKLAVLKTARAVPLEIVLEGAYNEVPFRAEGAVGLIRDLVGDEPYPVQLSIEVGGATIAVEGRIAEPLAGRGIDLKVQARGQSLADLGALSGAALPPLGPYDLGARVVQNGQTYELTSLTAKMGSSDLAGNATLALGGARPALSGSFTAAALSLDDFAPAGEESAAAPAQDGDGRFVFSEDPLPLAALMAVDAEIKLSVKRLTLKKGLALTDLELSLVLKKGNLKVKPFSAGLAGGKLAGDLSLNAARTAPPLTVNLTASGIDYGSLLKTLEVTDGVTGTLDAEVRLHGAGASLRAIAAGLVGRIEVIGGQGSIRNDLVQAAGAGLTQMLSGWSEGGGDLRLNCIVVRLPVEAGVATGEVILLDTAAATVGGTGTIDLRDESLDLRVTPQAKQTSLMSLAVPFRIGGTLAAPSVGPDPVGTALGAAKIAGLFINPLAAGAALVLESDSGEQNPCLAALERPAQATSQPAREKSTVEEAAEGMGKALEGIGEGITKGLKSLFGN